MKLHIEQIPTVTELELTVRCRALDNETQRLIALLHTFETTDAGTAGPTNGAKLMGEKDGETCLLSAYDVLYADTADKHIFLYTTTDVYQTPLRLYELEERLAHHGFVRASKSALLNLNRVKSLRPDFGGRLLVTLQNDERISVSRQYVPDIKALLGL